jgi:chromosomal replication initiation ATPase DnaA
LIISKMTTTDRADILAILHAHHDLLGVDRSRIKALMAAMSSVYTSDMVTEPHVQAAIQAVEQATNYTLFSIQLKDRRRPIVEARQIMAYILRDRGLTLHETGHIIARDHSDVVHCVKVVENNPKIFNARIKEIQTRLNQTR